MLQINHNLRILEITKILLQRHFHCRIAHYSCDRSCVMLMHPLACWFGGQLSSKRIYQLNCRWVHSKLKMYWSFASVNTTSPVLSIYIKQFYDCRVLPIKRWINHTNLLVLMFHHFVSNLGVTTIKLDTILHNPFPNSVFHATCRLVGKTLKSWRVFSLQL